MSRNQKNEDEKVRLKVIKVKIASFVDRCGIEFDNSIIRPGNGMFLLRLCLSVFVSFCLPVFLLVMTTKQTSDDMRGFRTR